MMGFLYSVWWVSDSLVSVLLVMDALSGSKNVKDDTEMEQNWTVFVNEMKCWTFGTRTLYRGRRRKRRRGKWFFWCRETVAWKITPFIWSPLIVWIMCQRFLIVARMGVGWYWLEGERVRRCQAELQIWESLHGSLMLLWGRKVCFALLWDVVGGRAGWQKRKFKERKRSRQCDGHGD